MIYNKIKVIVPFYNCVKFIDSCVNSLLTQDYNNYEILFIDDCSNDGTYEKLPAGEYYNDESGNPIKDENGNIKIHYNHPLLKKTKCLNVEAWRNEIRQTALPNLHNAIMNFSKDPNDIVVIVDGDDALLSKSVFSYINELYNDTDAWMIYGSSRWTDGRKCCSSPYSEAEFENIRKAPFRISHIRTFRAGLYHKIKEQDPTFSCLKDEQGEYYKSSYDTCMFFPMLELAGYENIKHNIKPLYLYNRHNPISDDKVDQSLQTKVHMEVSNKKHLNKIQSYK